VRRDIVARQSIATFLCIASATRDELRQVAVARAIGREQSQLGAIVEREFAADDELQPAIPGSQMGANNDPPASTHR
jgi:hypothetical protein